MKTIITEQEINETIKQTRQLLQQAKKSHKNLPEGSLNIRLERGRINYAHNLNGIRRGITKNEIMVHKLARKKYLETHIKTLESNLSALNTLLKTYNNIDPYTTIAKLKKPLQELPIEVYVPFIQRKNRWMNEPFEQSTLFQEEKDQVTARGLPVRSKSEVIISERFDYYDVAYRYEQLLSIGDRIYVPDFTILTKRGIVYWEHCGKTDDPEYMRKHRKKIATYESAGIVPWKNLIITYDKEGGGIDTRIIDSEIINKLL